ncbi:G2/mitotic-specific cyclin-B1 [Numida meleagris]|uniref:G2/mitotic-specific cyclin-B1 n=1 Tax=Numida meleagris TaxID=8996 RepID=UPI000B3DBBF9|nr:G2/mitotic-specific cyclin-B1 [Numida meleagris]
MRRAIPQNTDRSAETVPDDTDGCAVPAANPDDARRRREPSTRTALLDVCSNLSRLPPRAPGRFSGSEAGSSTTVTAAPSRVLSRFRRRGTSFGSPFPAALPGRKPWCRNARKAAAKEAVLLPLLQEELKPKQLEYKSPTETSECASTETQLCKAFSDVLLEVEVVNAEGSADSYPCNDYERDIYNYLRDLEMRQAIKPQYLAGQEITGTMRAMLIDWLVQIHLKLKLFQETLYLSVAILDRFLQDNAETKRNLKLVGITALFLASKYEEINIPPIDDFSSATANAFTATQICRMETKILQALDFSFSRPLPLHFLRRASKFVEVDEEQQFLAKYLLELSILDYDMVHFPPSMTAAAAFCLAMKLVDGGTWTSTLEQHTSYSESDLHPVMQHLAKNVVLVNKGMTEHMAVKNKYARSENFKIKTQMQLNSPLIYDLALPLVDSFSEFQ